MRDAVSVASDDGLKQICADSSKKAPSLGCSLSDEAPKAKDLYLGQK